MKILHIDSCPLGNSVSRNDTAAAVAGLIETDPQASVLYRDLVAVPLSHVSTPLLQALRHRWDTNIPMSRELNAEVRRSSELLREFLDADVAVIGAPMFNFFLPSALKAWVDRLVEFTTVFGALRLDTRVILVISAGPGMDELMSSHETLLKSVFQAMGLSRLEVVRDSAEFLEA